MTPEAQRALLELRDMNKNCADCTYFGADLLFSRRGGWCSLGAVHRDPDAVICEHFWLYDLGMHPEECEP